MVMNKLVILIILVCGASLSRAQILDEVSKDPTSVNSQTDFPKNNYLINASFEGKPARGVVDSYSHSRPFTLANWEECGSGETSPPDVHGEDTRYWGATFPPSNGKTYIGLVTRDTDTWEAVSQEFKTALEANKCYQFEIDARMDKNYKSPVIGSGIEEVSFGNPVVLRVSYSNRPCNTDGIQLKSNPITSTTWKTISLDFKNSKEQEFTHLTIEAYYKDGQYPYNGNLMIDNASLKEVSCKN